MEPTRRICVFLGFCGPNLNVPKWNLHLAATAKPELSVNLQMSDFPELGVFQEQGDTPKLPKSASTAFKNHDFQHFVRTPWGKPQKQMPSIPNIGTDYRQDKIIKLPDGQGTTHPPLPAVSLVGDHNFGLNPNKISCE